MQVSVDIVSTFKTKSVSYSIKSIIAQNPVTRKGAENYLVSFLSGQEGAVHLASCCQNRNIWPSFREEMRCTRVTLGGDCFEGTKLCVLRRQLSVTIAGIFRFYLGSSTASVALCYCCCIAL